MGIVTAVMEIINYLWDDELKSFQEHAADDPNNVCGHIFVTLCQARTFIEARQHDPQHYLQRDSRKRLRGDLNNNDGG